MTKKVDAVAKDSHVFIKEFDALARLEDASWTDNGAGAARVTVNKAYKMYVGGAFVRSESGRYEQVRGTAEGSADPEVVNVPRGSRKDARDAVVVAKAAQDGWAARTAYNRGQILYRLAEVMESRRAELAASLERAGAKEAEAREELDCAIDRTVYYAGFCDKIQSLLASHNPVAGRTSVSRYRSPRGSSRWWHRGSRALVGLVSTLLPVIAGGNVCVAIAGEDDPRTAVVFCECLATSDLPGGVVNVLLGRAAEIAPHLAKHREVAAIDAWTEDGELAALLEREGSGSVKRVKTHDGADIARLGGDRGQGIGYVERFLEMKTVWHPVGV